MPDRPDPSSGTDLSPLERAIDVALFWPFDLGVLAADRLPRTAGRVREQLVFARFIGRLAVQQGNVEIRRRLENPSVGPPAAVEPEADPPATGRVSTDAPDVTAEDLALPDYDQLPAAHVVEKLDGLDARDRDLIEAYEAANRGRRTVLGKLDRLRER